MTACRLSCAHTTPTCIWLYIYLYIYFDVDISA